jgi:hypothetical protein
VWQAGYWDWNGQNYSWVQGQWVRPPRADYVWVEPRWVVRSDGTYMHVPGRWKGSRSYGQGRVAVRTRTPERPQYRAHSAPSTHPPPPRTYGTTRGLSEVPAGVVRDQPLAMGNHSGGAYWVWWTPDGMWHVRVRAPYGARRFYGRIAAPSGMLQALPLGEQQDRIVLKDSGFSFDFTTRGGTDGMDFRAGGDQCVRFVLNIENESSRGLVFLGRNGYHAPSNRFVACP